jgi:putative ABC transport system ATP-binding protein/lipoprotein-releasing system ATP-binding protein
MPQVITEKVTKVYFVHDNRIDAVKDASLKINRGEFVSIVGHSGSGKTTLLSMIGGVVNPTSGNVLYEGEDIYTYNSDRLSDYRCEKIGFMFQFASLLPILTAKENLLLPPVFKAKKSDKNGNEQKAIELLKMVGLGDKIDAYPSQLSGGQQRRVAIARAFMNDPELILADEPTGDLDEETEADMVKFFQRMNEEKDITFIMVTHNTELARRTKRCLRMNNGMLEES